MDIKKEAINLHRKYRGKIQVVSKIELKTKEDLSLVYTPGVAEACKEIKENPDLAYEYTSRGSMVAVVTDGSAVLGLGNIGPSPAMPVMEGKAVLFKELGQVDAFPICLESQETEDIIFAIKQIAPDYIEHNGQRILEGGGIITWTTDVFHRIVSGDDGSASINLATHLEGFDIRTNFNIYDLNVETGEYKLIREGYKDQKLD